MHECKCGCGESISDIDARGRPVSYKNGHQNKGKRYAPEVHHKWNGGRYIDRFGYVNIRSGKRYLGSIQTRYRLEHRVVMEKMLGRKLLDTEVVHHIDGDKTNNNPDNLLICSRSEHNTVFHPDIVKRAGIASPINKKRSSLPP